MQLEDWKSKIQFAEPYTITGPTATGNKSYLFALDKIGKFLNFKLQAKRNQELLDLVHAKTKQSHKVSRYSADINEYLESNKTDEQRIESLKETIAQRCEYIKAWESASQKAQLMAKKIDAKIAKSRAESSASNKPVTFVDFYNDTDHNNEMKEIIKNWEDRGISIYKMQCLNFDHDIITVDEHTDWSQIKRLFLLEFGCDKPFEIEILDENYDTIETIVAGPFQFKIEAEDNYASLWVRPNGRAFCASIDDGASKLVHPHVSWVSSSRPSAWSDVCLGEIAPDFHKATQEINIGYIINTTLAWATYGNSDDVWGARYIYFLNKTAYDKLLPKKTEQNTTQNISDTGKMTFISKKRFWEISFHPASDGSFVLHRTWGVTESDNPKNTITVFNTKNKLISAIIRLAQARLHGGYELMFNNTGLEFPTHE